MSCEMPARRWSRQPTERPASASGPSSRSAAGSCRPHAARVHQPRARAHRRRGRGHGRAVPGREIARRVSVAWRVAGGGRLAECGSARAAGPPRHRRSVEKRRARRVGPRKRRSPRKACVSRDHAQLAASASSAAFVIAAAVVGTANLQAPFERGWWLTAYLFLVGGLAQLLLIRGQDALTAAPSRPVGRPSSGHSGGSGTPERRSWPWPTWRRSWRPSMSAAPRC